MAAFRVFISSTTADLAEARRLAAGYFESIGAQVDAQRPYPDTLNNSEDIRSSIEDADLCVCLVGHYNGAAVAFAPPGTDMPRGVSWTQWELLYALEQHYKRAGDHTRARLLICFAEDFFNKNLESEALRASQKAFRQNLHDRLQATPGSPFFLSFNSELDLVGHLRHMMEGAGGQISVVLDRRWEAFKDLYTAYWANEWEAVFPPGTSLSELVKDRNDWFGKDSALFGLSKPPLIDTQRFAVIAPDTQGRQLARAESFTENTSHDIDFDTLREAAVGNLDGDELVAPARRDGRHGRGARLALVTGAGLGKTTTLNRLRHEINRSGAKFAVLLFAGDLENLSADTETNLERVIRSAIRRTENAHWWSALGMSADAGERDRADSADRKLQSPLALLGYGILHEARRGRLVILVDGLDHAGTAKFGIARLQSEPTWEDVDVVVSGRPYAFESWKRIESDLRAPDERHWRVLVPLGVSDNEAKAYLGGIVGSNVREWRHVFCVRHFENQLGVPRLLEHLRYLGVQELVEAATSADIYYSAIRHLIREGHIQAGNSASDQDVERSMKVLAALAFETVFDLREGDGTLLEAPQYPHSFYATYPEDSLVNRLAPLFRHDGDVISSVQAELKRLHRLAALLNNGLLVDSVSAGRGTANWASLTVQRFLAAYWLATGAKVVFEPHEDDTDADWFRAAQYYRYGENAGLTEELNRFLAEMPTAVIDARSWLGAALAWYDPVAQRRRSADDHLGPRRKRWPTEMIARSWRTVHLIANRPVDDWWDISYDELSRAQVGKRRSNARRMTIPAGATSEVTKVAKAVLDAFFSDFDSLRSTNEVAQAFASTGWQAIPGADFAMGSPEAQQGFPEKTEAFWLKLLDESIDEDLDTLATRTTPAFWWPGLYGQRAQRDEIAWLKYEVFGPYREAAHAGEAAKARGLERAMNKLRDNFRRPDESPLEPAQTVRPFDLCALPVTNEVYALFSSAHIEDARGPIEHEQSSHMSGYLAQGRPIVTGEGDHRHDEWHLPERPAFHITWFDAWVFAQWARWQDGDVTYRCRLPHEPEWEFACKRKPLARGESVEAPFGQKYWWGNAFYKRPKDPTEESISIDNAHAFGWPGATRPPAHAKPNGYGLKDMIGNVWEWCANIYDERSEAEIKADPQRTRYSRLRPQTALRYDAPRVIRGGLWWYLNHISTASSRFRLEPSDGDYKTGFRLVRERLR